jgi:hypothetical protein
MQRGPFHVLVLVFPHRVVFLLDHIHKTIASGIDPKYSRSLYGMFLLVSFPSMSDMRESLKECKGDLFSVGKIVNKEITF